MSIANSRYSCRFCSAPLGHSVVDLGATPLCQRHITPKTFDHAESIYPLHLFVCVECFLVQLPAYVDREEVFNPEYAYLSSYSDTWLGHVARYVDMMISRFNLTTASKIVEIASNDGSLLRHFVRAGIPNLGIEPAIATATVAVQNGVRTITKFFGEQTAREVLASEGPADVIVGNNVLAHVPDLHDFVRGMKLLLARGGVITMEFPHLLHLIDGNCWDTIYHEHFSYLWLSTAETIFAKHGLTLFDVDELKTHGGSLRIYARHTGESSNPVHDGVLQVKESELKAGRCNLGYYKGFANRVKESKRALLEFLIKEKRGGKSIAAYGAPGKGNTLLNYCGIGTDFIDYTVDRNPHKQGNYLPGSRIPICPPQRIAETKPDYLLILPWNLSEEIIQQVSHVRSWGGKFLIPIPTLTVLD